MIEFKKAVKSEAKLKIAITGPSGSGKTYSALSMAQGLGDKIAFVDTENGSASLYSDKFDFSVINMNAPYLIEKYIMSIKAAEDAGFDILVIDSLSHGWSGDGGILARKNSMDVRGGNSYTNWASFTKEQESLVSVILSSKIHLICTMRSKQDYIMSENGKGKMSPQKVGLAPIQREGTEYEFTTVFDVAMNHEASISKDRTGLFDNQFFKITKETGLMLKNWLNETNLNKEIKNERL